MPYKTVAPEVGARFGRLTVTGTLLKPRSDGRNRTAVLVRCDCGTEKEVWAFNLFSGNTQSCGCLHKEMASKANTSHGDKKANKRLYRIWRGMGQRCNNPQAQNYPWYGGKGIQIEWDSYQEFRDWALANGYDDALQIDRVDPAKNYCPSNCRWITKAENISRARTPFSENVEVALGTYCSEYGLGRYAVIEEALVAFLRSAGKEV